MRGRRRRAATAVVVCAGIVLAGCSGLPRSSSVGQGLEIGAPNNLRPIRLQFEAPPAGAGPVEIVRGFLNASWSVEDDFAAARAYLAPDTTWDPRAQVVVYPGSEDLLVDGEGEQVSLLARTQAKVTRDGRLGVAEEPEEATLTLRQVDGEWRIAQLPDGFGVWLSRFYFEQAYRSLTVTYADEGAGTLLVDNRWFPLGSGLATTIARTQLLPVPGYLEDTVGTGFPEGTTLAVDSVPVVDQVARIELSREALTMTTDQRRAAWAQMLRTMRQVPGVSAVELSVDGGPLQVLGTSVLPTSTSELGYSTPTPLPAAIVVRDRTYLTAMDFTGWLRGGESQRPVEANLPDVDERWGHLAVSSDLDDVAAVDDARTQLRRWRDGEEGSPARFGSSLTEPAFDASGRLWVAGVGSDGASRIWWFDPVSGPTAAPTSLPGVEDLGGRVIAVKPAPGGRRLAIAVEKPSGNQVILVGGVGEAADGTPSGLTSPWAVATGFSDLRDLTWVDETSLATLAALEGEDVAPHIVPLGGFVETLSRVRDPHHLVTSGSARGLVVLSGDDTVWRRVGGGWQEHGQVDDLVVPGS
ncbi:MAG: LpqB family beta-propeller domain-containing protein [Mobilicoccus sp.]|nr:LpqB family beta-propeller domain-containing protein [Mobilicoccus sp.]